MLTSLSKRLPERLRFALRRMGLAASITLLSAACSNASQDISLVRSLLPNAAAQATTQTPAQAIAQATAEPDWDTPDWDTIEREIITEHSRVRQNPESYIPILEAYLATMDSQGNIPNGCGPNCTLLTEEGRSAVEEAINFLRNQAPVGPLDYSEAIARAAESHAQDQRGGALGHVGSDGSRIAQRLDRFNVERASSGENIDYGSTSAQGVLVSLIVDDGVASRGHRTNIFSPDWTTAGAGCGPHATIRTVCVINYAKISRQLTVINQGTVPMMSLRVAGVDLLGGTLAVGESRTVTLPEGQSCETDATIQLGGGYESWNWDGIMLCGAEMMVNGRNGLNLSY